MITLGSFALLEVIGDGGMSRVYRAEHLQSGEPAAVKLLTPALARTDLNYRSLRREVRALARLHHAATVQIYGMGQVTRPEAEVSADLVAESPWLAMELIEGESLRRWPAHMGWNALGDIVLDLLDALAHAHARGVLHRDIKPSNLLWCDGAESTTVKVIDFGLTRLLGGAARSEQEGGAVVGTPNYMAPEQILGRWREHGPATDLYALGCVIWRLVTGSAPFDDGGDDNEILNRQLDEDPPVLRPRFEVPDRLESWLRHMMQKRPETRFSSAAEARWALMGLDAPSSHAISTEPWSRDEEATKTITLPHRGDTETGGTNPSMEAPIWWNRTPPVPSDWREDTRRSRPGGVSRAGLSLFGLREIPLVARQAERDQLWQVVRRARSEETPSTVLLRGAPGLGKSRLARWLCRRAHQTAGAVVLEVEHTPLGGSNEGLRAMLRRYFRCSGLATDRAAERIEEVCRERLGMDETAARSDALSLAAFMCEGSTQDVAGFSTPRERHRALTRLLSAVAGDGLVVLWLDELHWGRQSARFLRHLVEEAGAGLPIAVVATARPDLLAQVPQQARLVEAIAKSAATESIEVGPLSDEEQGQLVDRLLDFDATVRGHIVERAAGNPLFAIQLVSYWIERGWLEEGAQGLNVADRADTPADIEALWQARLDAVCEAVGRQRRGSVQRCIEIGAALGLSVDMSEWERACELCDVPAPRAVIEALALRGLVRAEERAWYFEHTPLRDALVRSSQRAGRWEDQNEVCARALREEYGENEATSARRRAHHRIEAGEYCAALRLLLVAADTAYGAGDYALVESLFEKRRRVRNLSRNTPDRESDGPELWRRGRLAFATGEVERARRLVAESIDGLAGADRPKELGRALFLEGRILRGEGELDEARARFQEALGQFAVAGDEDGLAYAEASLGYVELMLGDTAAARRHFEAALEVFEELDDAVGRGRMHTILAYTSMSDGHCDDAERHYERALELTRRAGDRPTEAEVLRSRGELARRRGDWEEAREYTRAALELHELSGARNVHLTRVGLALIELGLERFDAAARRLDEAESTFAEVGYEARLPVVYAAQIACSAGRAEWCRCEERLAQTRRSIEETEAAHEDIASSAELAAEYARAAGRDRIARGAQRIARMQRNSIGSRVDDR